MKAVLVEVHDGDGNPICGLMLVADRAGEQMTQTWTDDQGRTTSVTARVVDCARAG